MRTWQEWVNGFNAVPTRMIEKLWKAYPYDWCEVTCPVKGDRVYVFETGSGEVIDFCHNNRFYKVRLDNGLIWRGRADLMEIDDNTRTLLWKTVWSFSDSLDNDWIDWRDGIQTMSRCGFRIFKSFEFGYFFGIDETVYKFCDQLWILLYKARCAR